MKRLLLTLCLPLGFGCSQMTNHSDTQITDDAPMFFEQRPVAAPSQ